MDELSGPIHIWVRTQKGSIFGPLIPTTVELLIDRGAIVGPIQIALDGKDYMNPGRVPGIRMVIPRELWGDNAAPEHPRDKDWAQVVLPPSLDSTVAASTGSYAPVAPAAPVAGPAVAPAAGPAVMPGPVPERVRTSGHQPRYVPGARAAAGVMPPRSSASTIQQNPTVSSPSTVSRNPSVPPVPVPPVTQSTVSRNPTVPAAGAVPPPPPARTQMPAPAAVPAVPAVEPTVAPVRPAPPPTTIVSAPLFDAAIPTKGDLSAFSALRVYFLSVASEQTALWTLTLPDRTLLVHFRKGSPDYVESTHVDDAVGTILVKNKLLTPEALAQAEAEKARFGGELVPALFGLGLVNPNSALTHLMQRATSILHRALLSDHGGFTFEAKEFQSQKAFPLGNKWGLYVEQLRRNNPADIRRRMTAMLDLPVMRGSGTMAPSDLRLTPQEMRVLTYFDGTRSLHQVARDVPQDAEVALRTAWMLFPCDLVAFATVRQAISPPQTEAAYPGGAPAAPVAPAAVAPAGPPPAAVAKPVAPAAAPAAAPGRPVITPAVAVPVGPPRPIITAAAPAPVGPPRPVVTTPLASATVPKARVDSSPTPVPVATLTFEEDLKKTLALRDTFKKANYFEILGVDKNADANVVKSAYFRMARLYHPDMVSKDAPPELARAKADIFSIVGDANRTLSDLNLRKDYVLGLESGGSDKVDLQSIMKAEELFRKGVINVKARKFPEAVKLIEDAIAAHPEEPEFYAWHGFARFFTIADKKAAVAACMPEIEKCIAKNPRVAAAYYFKGYLCKAAGDNSGARTNFKKCVELDVNHVDAQRELRMMK